MGVHEGFTEVAPTGIPVLPAFATPGPGLQGVGKARLLDFDVDKAAEGDVTGRRGQCGPRMAGKDSAGGG